MRYLLSLLILLLLHQSAYAELAVCFNSARTLGTQFYYNPSVDPSRVTDPHCSVVSKASGQTQAQLDLINSTIRGLPAPTYLKVAGGLAVPMEAAEMDAVDAYRAQVAANKQLLGAELSDPTVCDHINFEDIEAKFDVLQSNLAADVNALTTNTAAAIRAEQQAVLTRLVNTLRKVTRCVFALKKSAGK